MRDLKGKEIVIGDTVAVLHKKRPITTATLQIGTVVGILLKDVVLK